MQQAATRSASRVGPIDDGEAGNDPHQFPTVTPESRGTVSASVMQWVVGIATVCSITLAVGGAWWSMHGEIMEAKAAHGRLVDEFRTEKLISEQYRADMSKELRLILESLNEIKGYLKAQSERGAR